MSRPTLVGHAQRPLAGVRVLELACSLSVAASYAGRLLADMGADVIKVEPPAGDPVRRLGPFPGDHAHLERGGLFQALNLNKRGLCLSLDGAEGRTRFGELAQASDVLLENGPPGYLQGRGLGAAALLERTPGLAVVSVTPFGQTGPQAGFRSCELVTYCAGGMGYITPQWAGEGERPLKPPERHAELMAGMNAALAAVAALRLRDRTGRGQRVDVSEQETLIQTLQVSVPRYTYEGQIPTRVSRPTLGPRGVFACRDGYVYIICVDEHQWEALVRVMGDPTWAREDWCRDRLARGENWDAVQALIEDWAHQYTKQELFERCGTGRVPCAPLHSIEEVLALPQYQHRLFHVAGGRSVARRLRSPGPPYRLSESPPPACRPAPRLGQHNGQTFAGRPDFRRGEAAGQPGLALDGVRVVEVSYAWAGPYCGMLLAELGADVIRVETATRPDVYRTTPPYLRGVPAEPHVGGGAYHGVNRSKRSITLDLHRPDAIALVKRLVALSDVVVENFAPRVMPALGLDYRSLRGVRPDLVMASLSGYGQDGPLAQYPAYGDAVWAYSGLGLCSGYPDRAPQWIGMPISDPMVSLTAAFAIISALRRRERTGQGEFIDLAQAELLGQMPLEGLLDWQMNRRQALRQGNHDRSAVPHGIYRCAGQDRWIAIACFDDEEWRRLCGAMGEPEWASSPAFATAPSRRAHQDRLDEMIEQWTQGHHPRELALRLQANGVRAGPVNDMRDLLEDEHLVARGFFVEVEQPGIGVRRYPGLPFCLAEEGAAVRAAAPALGEHNSAVLGELLGLTGSEFSSCVERGIIR